MVIRNTFTGTVTDEELNVSKTINLNLTSATTTTAVSHYPAWSKVLLNAVYTVLVDAGYTPTKNEEDYSIEIWGFKFYVLGGVYSSSYKIVPYIYAPGYTFGGINQYILSNDRGHSTGISKSACQTTVKSDEYKFTLTLRGNDDMFMLQLGGYDYPSQQYNLFFVAKAHYVPKNADAFIYSEGLAYSGLYYTAVLADDLYTPVINHMANVLYYVSDYENTDTGVGLGYYKIPQTTRDYDFIIKGMIYTNMRKVTAGEYYKLGNEIYYANKSEESSSSYPFLYKVDTVPTDV